MLLPKIYTANHATFTILIHSRYTRMAGFGRREIEYMQAICIYNKYIECYSVHATQGDKSYPILRLNPIPRLGAFIVTFVL